jgi:hypothetical protein
MNTKPLLANTLPILEASEKHAIWRKSTRREKAISREWNVGNGDARRVTEGRQISEVE